MTNTSTKSEETDDTDALVEVKKGKKKVKEEKKETKKAGASLRARKAINYGSGNEEEIEEDPVQNKRAQSKANREFEEEQSILFFLKNYHILFKVKFQLITIRCGNCLWLMAVQDGSIGGS